MCRHVLACSAIAFVIVVCWGRCDGAKASADDATEATATDKCARERTIVGGIVPLYKSVGWKCSFLWGVAVIRTTEPRECSSWLTRGSGRTLFVK